MQWLSKIDAHWIDACVILIGFLGVFFKPLLRKFYQHPPCFRSTEILTDFGNFGALFLSIILFLSPLSTELLQQLTSASKPTLAVGGLVCIVSFIREIVKFK